MHTLNVSRETSSLAAETCKRLQIALSRLIHVDPFDKKREEKRRKWKRLLTRGNGCVHHDNDWWFNRIHWLEGHEGWRIAAEKERKREREMNVDESVESYLPLIMFKRVWVGLTSDNYLSQGCICVSDVKWTGESHWSVFIFKLRAETSHMA